MLSSVLRIQFILKSLPGQTGLAAAMGCSIKRSIAGADFNHAKAGEFDLSCSRGKALGRTRMAYDPKDL